MLRRRRKAKVPDAGRCGKGIDESGRIDKGVLTIKTIVSTKAVVLTRRLWIQNDRIDEGGSTTKESVSIKAIV